MVPAIAALAPGVPESEHEQRAAAGLAHPGRDRVRSTGAEPDLLEHGARLVRSAAAEPAEQLLRAVGDERAADAHPKGEQAEVARAHAALRRSVSDRAGCTR